MKLNLVPAYLKDVTFKTEKVRDSQIKVVVLSFFVQPLSPEIAARMGIDGELFLESKVPNPILRKGDLILGDGRKTHLVQMHPTVDGSTDPMFETNDAFLGSFVKVKRDKEAPIFYGSFEVIFAFPPAKDLLALANGISEQYWINIEPANPGLFEEADREATRDEKKRKKRTVQTRDTTDGVENAVAEEMEVDDNAGPTVQA